MPMPYRQPSAEVMALAQKFEADVRRLAGIIEIPVGEGRMGNTPVGTVMAYIEAVSQVPGAVHKDDHIAQAEEFALLRELFAEEPEALWRGRKDPARKWQVAAEVMDPDLMPAADPNTPSAIHRLMKLQAMVQLSGMPQFAPKMNLDAVLDHVLQLLAGSNPQEFRAPPTAPPPPPPDPRIVAAQIKAQSDQAKVQADMAKEGQQHQERMAELAQEGAQRDADRQSAETRAAIGLEATRLKTAHDTAAAAADRAHEAGIVGAQLVQKHVQHLNELGAQQDQQAQAAQQPQGGAAP
jgi:hypothetical protein